MYNITFRVYLSIKLICLPRLFSIYGLQLGFRVLSWTMQRAMCFH